MPSVYHERFSTGESADHAVADEAPLPPDPPGDGDALARLADDGDLQGHVRDVLAGGGHDADRRRRADGDHQRLRRLDTLDLEVLRGPDDALEEVDLNGHPQDDFGHAARRSHDPPDEAVGLREARVEVRADRDEPSGPHLLARGASGMQGTHGRGEVLPLRPVADRDLAPGGDLDLVADAEVPLDEASAEDPADELLWRGARLVHVERPRDVHLRRLRFVVRLRRDDLVDEHEEDVEVHVMVGRDGNDWRSLRDGPLDEVDNLLVVLTRLLRVDDVDLVLDHDDAVHTDDPEGHEVLFRLRLRALLVRGDHEERAVHDCRATQHRRHEGLVAGGIDERDDPLELPFRSAVFAGVRGRVRLRRLALRAAVDGHVRVPQADGDASLDLLGVAIRPLPGQALCERGLAMVHVPDDADVHDGLVGNLHRVCSCHASSIDFGPRWTIFRFSWRMSGETAFPRTVFFFRIPGRAAWKPTPPLRRSRFRRGPGRSGRIGKPSLSLPPVIWSLYPGRPTYRPSTSSPTFFPTSALA